MTKTGNWITVFLTAFVMAACGPESDRYGEDTVPEGTETPRGTQMPQGTEMPETTRDAFTSTADQELDRLQQELDELIASLEETAEETETELTEEIQQWEQEHQALARKLDSAQAVSESEWEQFQSEVNVALDELRRSLDDVSSRVRASTSTD